MKIDYELLHRSMIERTNTYASRIKTIYQGAFDRIIEIIKECDLEDDKPFNFTDYGYSEDVTPVFRNMYSQLYQEYRKDITFEFNKANKDNDNLVKAIFGARSIEDNHYAKFFHRNMEALDAFFTRKNNGMNLSQRVWMYVGLFKQELQDTIDLALGEGTAANSLAARIKHLLNEPDRFYRRFRVKTGEDENGNPIYGRIWKRRIYDRKTGLYQWVNEDPRKYHSGMGVYRSSARNAQRLARTETNIAYRTADYNRWQTFDFVVGCEIKVSNNHPYPDICDDLAGFYPKDFKWTGWHPNCRCYMVPVLAAEYEIQDMIGKLMENKSSKLVDSDNEIKKMPQCFTTWLDQNWERYQASKKKGTLPYWIKDNERYFKKAS